MAVIALIGFLVFFGSLVYLVYHFIRKIINRDRTLSKKKFYPALLGGFLLMIVGVIFTDTTLLNELSEAEEDKITLTEDNAVAQSEKEELEMAKEKLEEEIQKLTEEIKALESKLPELEKKEDELNKLKSVHKEDLNALKDEISTLEATNSSLKDAVDNLE